MESGVLVPAQRVAKIPPDDALVKQQILLPQRLVQAIGFPQIGSIGPRHIWGSEKIDRIPGDAQQSKDDERDYPNGGDSFAETFRHIEFHRRTPLSRLEVLD